MHDRGVSGDKSQANTRQQKGLLGHMAYKLGLLPQMAEGDVELAEVDQGSRFSIQDSPKDIRLGMQIAKEVACETSRCS